uniref:(northern house mosquito) hypothetical protein n=1 Tax=Culex pipiens TaxID=7175 RepID=A0A8D8G1L2_CULPI
MGILFTKSDDKDLDETSTTKVISLEEHFERRVLRFMHLGGMGQYISSVTGLEREEIFRSGASRHQDQTCPIPDHHAAHIVSALVSNTIRTTHLELFEGVEEYLACTDIIPSDGTLWPTIGGEFDREQESLLKPLSTIVFDAEKTAEVTLKLEEFRDSFVEVFNAHIVINSWKYLPKRIVQLTKVHSKLSKVTAEDMFSTGRMGIILSKMWNM